MRRSSGSTVDVGVSGVFTGTSVLLVFWWVFFMESLSGADSLVGGLSSWRVPA
jgi:hypothetical protein